MAGFPCTILCPLVGKFSLLSITRQTSRDWLFRSIGILCFLYIDDRHNGQLQVSLDKGEYGSLATADEGNLGAAECAIFLVAYYLVKLGYLPGLSKSILHLGEDWIYGGLLKRDFSFDS